MGEKIEKIKKILQSIKKEKALYYRLLDDSTNDEQHYNIMEGRGAEILYGFLPSEEGDGINYYAMGLIPIEKVFDFVSSWEIHPHEGIGKDLTIRGENNDGDLVTVVVFPKGAPVGVLFGGVEIPPEIFNQIWEEFTSPTSL
jgi:hypothetical protein